MTEFSSSLYEDFFTHSFAEWIFDNMLHCFLVQYSRIRPCTMYVHRTLWFKLLLFQDNIYIKWMRSEKALRCVQISTCSRRELKRKLISEETGASSDCVLRIIKTRQVVFFREKQPLLELKWN